MSHIEVLETPDKSEADKKSYRVIRLPNGLKALLISDFKAEAEEGKTNVGDKSNDELSSSSTKLAACAFCIDVGSFSDPRDVQGLAHFLEHMLLMGSEKYPTENEITQYLQKAGGASSAITGLDETTFYFQITEEYLDGALDRYSQLFKSPLMLKEAMTREREAVESEFLLKKDDEDNRRGQLLASIGQSSHPSSIFPWGNLQTLKNNVDDETLYRKVHDFRKRHYSAHRMYVALQSRLPLDDLQDLVVKHFENVPNNQLPGDDFSQFNHLNAFEPKFYDSIYFVKPIGNVTELCISWCIESTLKKFKTKPDQYLSYILGDEGKGSLLSYLRKKLWAVKLYAGNNLVNSLFSRFDINVHLTDDGLDHLEDVLRAIFGFLKLLQVAGPNERIFREIQNISANRFRFENEEYALYNVVGLSKALKQYPPKYVVTADFLYFDYNAEAIQKVIDEITSRRFNIMITSTRRYDDDVMYESTEPWFGTQYTERRMPDKWIELWENAKPFEEFSLPEPNPFIVDDFSLLYDKSSVVPKHPIKILDNDSCELWFKADNEYLLPIACYNFYFQTPQAIASIDNTISLEMIVHLLNHHLAEKLYPAQLAGLEYYISSADLGLKFTVSGFSQKLHLIVDCFTKSMKSIGDEITEKQFEVFVDRNFKSYENLFIDPNELAGELLSSVINVQHSPMHEKNKRLRSIRFEDFQLFCRNFCQHLRVKSLMQGNIAEERAQAIMQKVLTDLECGIVQDLSQLALKVKQVPIGSHYLRCSSFNLSNANTSVLNNYQIGPTTYRTQALIDLLTLIADEPLRDTLHVKEQLAYSVACFMQKDHGILSYNIKVSSHESKHAVEHVVDRIENFRRELVSTITNMSDNEFDELKASLTKTKLEADNNLSTETSRHWKEIESNEYDFDRVHKEVQCLAAMTKVELLEFYRSHHGEQERMLSIQIIGNPNGNDCENVVDGVSDGNGEKDKEMRQKQFDSLSYVDFKKSTCGKLVSDLVEFKNTLENYPVSGTETEAFRP